MWLIHILVLTTPTERCSPVRAAAPFRLYSKSEVGQRTCRNSARALARSRAHFRRVSRRHERLSAGLFVVFHRPSTLKPSQNTDTDSTFLDSKALVASILDDAHAFFQSVDLSSLRKAAVRLAKYARSLEETQAAQYPNEGTTFTDEDIPDLNVALSHEEPITDEIIDNADGLADKLWHLNLNWSSQGRYFGKGSNVHFIKSAVNMRDGYAGGMTEKSGLNARRRMEFWTLRHVSTLFWPTSPSDLVDLYFRTNEMWLPIMHRPTMDKYLASQLYLRDRSFGYLVLTMCAMASRHADDSRVFADPRPECESSAGWQWWSQVELARKTYRTAPSLFEIQTCTVRHHGSYSTIALSLGIRLAHEVGAHRKRKTNDPIEDELYKRVFWALINEDIQLAAYMGRPRATTCQDIDLDPVLEVEDEYWHDPASQPPGCVARGVYFNQYIRIMHILAKTLCVFCLRRVHLRGNMSRHEWERRVVACIDSALNSWRDKLPESLRWDPNRPNAELREQAASLCMALYLAQIQLHRPFIANPDGGLSFASLAICANAARAALRLMVRLSELSFTPYPHAVLTLFSACIILILYVWHRQQTGNVTDGEKDIKLVLEGLQVMSTFEKRWQFPGRLADVISNLLPANGFSFSASSASQGKKRAREGGVDGAIEAPATSSSNSPPGDLPESVPSAAAAAFSGIFGVGITDDEVMQLFSLPSDPPSAPENCAGLAMEDAWATLGDGSLTNGPDNSAFAFGGTGPAPETSTYSGQGHHQNPFDSAESSGAGKAMPWMVRDQSLTAFARKPSSRRSSDIWTDAGCAVAVLLRPVTYIACKDFHGLAERMAYVFWESSA
ncbi:hypothetical protein HDZ31DRAFT_40779 [Schizophyllum fasciatum]